MSVVEYTPRPIFCHSFTFCDCLQLYLFTSYVTFTPVIQ